MNDKYLLAGSEVLSREFNDLGSFYSDFHKDVHGTRPRHMALCASAYPDHESLVDAYGHLERLVQGLQDYLTAMKATFQGREQLRDEGWQIEETDPSTEQETMFTENHELAAKLAASAAHDWERFTTKKYEARA